MSNQLHYCSTHHHPLACARVKPLQDQDDLMFLCFICYLFVSQSSVGEWDLTIYKDKTEHLC